MMTLLKILYKLFQPRCQHIPGIYFAIEESELNEPGGKPRKVKMRMGCVKCEKCNKVFKWIPMGVAHDPVKGIYMKENEPFKRHADLDKKGTKKLIEALAAEGIEI